MIKVSVAIITWNRKDKVLRAIESVCAQSYQPIEVVVADSASTDGTLEEIEKRYPEIKTIRLHENLGCPGGRNIALANCTGNIIISLDDDGWLQEETVAGCVQRFTGDQSVGVIGFKITPPGGERDCGEDRESNVFSGGAMAIRKDVLKAVGYYPTVFFRQAEEVDLALRIIEGGYRIMNCPSLTMYHEVSHTNKNANNFLFYSCRNELSIVVRLYPLFMFPFFFLYKTVLWNIVGLKKRALHFTVFGTLAAIGETPNWLMRRDPVSWNTIHKYISLSKGRY